MSKRGNTQVTTQNERSHRNTRAQTKFTPYKEHLPAQAVIYREVLFLSKPQFNTQRAFLNLFDTNFLFLEIADLRRKYTNERSHFSKNFHFWRKLLDFFEIFVISCKSCREASFKTSIIHVTQNLRNCGEISLWLKMGIKLNRLKNMFNFK